MLTCVEVLGVLLVFASCKSLVYTAVVTHLHTGQHLSLAVPAFVLIAPPRASLSCWALRGGTVSGLVEHLGQRFVAVGPRLVSHHSSLFCQRGELLPDLAQRGLGLLVAVRIQLHHPDEVGLGLLQ